MNLKPGLPEKLQDYISEHQLFEKKDELLVACSGGIDSVVLCELLFRLGYRFSIAHCNFQLRAKESDDDESFVKSLGEKYGVEVYTRRFETLSYATSQKISMQVAARVLRYEWFEELMTTHDFKALLTAHHADDDAETVLMNLFKGTGISGMHGILPKRNKIVRPLLFATRQHILSFAEENNIEWREDASNATDKYTRNFFRHQVIPLIEKIVPNAGLNLAQSIVNLKEAELLYRQRLAEIKKKLLEQKGEEIHIPVLKLAKMVPLNTIVYEIIKDYGFDSGQVSDLLSLLQAETGKYISSATHRIIRNRKWLIIAPLHSDQSDTIIIEDVDSAIFFRQGSIQLSFTENTQPSGSPDIATLDAKEIRFPLLLRKWKNGDYLYPLGMRKKKKVARLLIDLKLSATEKEKVWVIESNKKIIWVVGYRIDDRFKITYKTKQILKFKWKNE